METKKRYNDFTTFLKGIFPERAQKISIDAGFTCPNRDGSKGTGGCIYCDNQTFTPSHAKSGKSITKQLLDGIAFFSDKYKTQKYLAYFQSFTGTYAPVSILENMYKEALSVPGVAGLVISTRPDCLNNSTTELLRDISKSVFVSIELGIESTNNETLGKINRCHTWEESKDSIERVHEAGILCGGHLILGLPGEGRTEILEHAKKLGNTGIGYLKLHQMQVIRGTELEKLFLSDSSVIKPFHIEEYIDIVIDFLELLTERIMIDRFTSESPRELVVAPDWGGRKNFEVVEMIRKQLEKRDAWQGSKFNISST